MEGIVFDIKRFAVHDGPGIRTTVFFKGCPLSCPWCHNPESSEVGITEMDKCYKIGEIEKVKKERVGKSYKVKELADEIKKDIIVMEESGGGVTFSGGEPLMQFDFLKEVLMQLKDLGIHTAVDTTGYTSEKNIKEIIPYTDMFLYDLKHYDNDKHIENTGVPLKPIIKNLHTILNQNKCVWIRIPVIPDVNISHEDKYGFLYVLQNMNKKPEQINLLPYHSISDNKYKRLNIKNNFEKIPSMNKKTLLPFKAMLERSGYKVKIGG